MRYLPAVATAIGLALSSVSPRVGSSIDQDPEGWKRNDRGRHKVLIKVQDEKKFGSLTFDWPSPAVPSEWIGELRNHVLSSLRRYYILGIENGCLKLTLETSYADQGRGLELDSVRAICLPPVDGAYYLYTPDSLRHGLGFRITANSPKPGLLDVQPILDKKE